MAEAPLSSDACPGCAAPVGNSAPCSHPYLAASAECWEAYGMLLALETERWGYPDAHRLVVDAYSAQHPGPGQDRRDRQSIFVHLASICLIVEFGSSSRRGLDLIRRMTRGSRCQYPALTRHGPGGLDLRHAWEATDLKDYQARSEQWATAVWESYGPSQPVIRQTVASLLDI